MTELSRSLLAAAREGLAPDAAIAARVRAKVDAAIGVAPAAAQAAPATPAAGSSATLLKLGAALLAVGVVATGIVVSAPARSPEVPQVAVASHEQDEVREDVKLAARGETVPAPPRIAAPRVVVSTPEPALAPVLTSRVEPEPASLSR